MNKTVIITGASSGVGYATCELMSSKGYNVIGLSRSDKKISELKNKCRNVEHYCVNLTDFEKTKNVFNAIITKYDNIDVLVNCAAVFQMIEFVRQDIEYIDTILDTNIRTYIYTSKLVLENMLSNKKGLIINVSSVSGRHGIENQTIYSSTKHALTGFGDSLNQEIVKNGVKVSTLYPGGIDTELWSEENMYRGNKQELLTPIQVAQIIAWVADLPENVVMKDMTFFPTNEIH
jgi:NADP-dependent 3-hydroxy acid dehydrogenase YdfG